MQKVKKPTSQEFTKFLIRGKSVYAIVEKELLAVQQAVAEKGHPRLKY